MSPADKENVDWLANFLKPHIGKTEPSSKKVVDITMEIVKEVVDRDHPSLSTEEKEYIRSRLYKMVTRGCC